MGRSPLTQLAAAAGLLLSVLGADAARAVEVQVDRRVPLQGVLAGTSGAVTVTVELYDVPVGGAPVWGPELHAVTADGQGRFSLLLGSVQPFIDELADGIPDLDQLDPAALFAQLTVLDGGAASPLSPRQRVFPAFHAESASVAELALGAPTGAIRSETVTDDALAAVHRGDPSVLQFAAFPDVEILPPSAGAPGPIVSVGSVAIVAPAAGFLVADAAAQVSSENARADCAVMLGSAVPGALEQPQMFVLPSAEDPRARTFLVTRGFSVPGGQTDVSIFCQGLPIAGQPDTGVDVSGAVLNVFYSPTRY